MGRRGFARRGLGMLAVAAIAGALSAGDIGAAFADGFGPGQKRRGHAVAKRPAPPQDLGQRGEIPLANGKIKLTVPDGYYFVPAAEARGYLQRIKAPAPAGDLLGMVAPAGVRSIDDNFWGAVLSINPMGHVAEEREARLADDDFIAEVRTSRAGGLAPDSFAAKPGYDASRRAATWAERYAAKNGVTRTYRGETRLLGRNSVVGVTIDAKPAQVATVQAASPTIAHMISFQPGQAYQDYSATSDGAAIYDLPSLLTNKTKPPAPTPAAAPAAEPAPQPAPTPAPPPPEASASTPIGGAQGIPAQSTGLQRIDSATTSEPAGTKTGMPSAELAKWMPWLAGGLVLLAVVPWLVGMARGAGRLQDDRPVRRKVVINPTVDPNLNPTVEESGRDTQA